MAKKKPTPIMRDVIVSALRNQLANGGGRLDEPAELHGYEPMGDIAKKAMGGWIDEHKDAVRDHIRRGFFESAQVATGALTPEWHVLEKGKRPSTRKVLRLMLVDLGASPDR